ncbi:MAG: hypothetical protein IK078_07340 [Lachnospiraceae bacterium]|nr:hypothetical protein [Lachnospiraceae bacterium]
MYITEKYWGEMIGGSDDSLTLGEYFADKGKNELTLKEIFEDFGIDDPDFDFKQGEEPVTVAFKSGLEPEIYYAIDVIMDLAAILLECRMNGSADLSELYNIDLDMKDPVISVTSSTAEEDIMKNVLSDLVADPMGYSLSEMCDEEEMQQLADLCEGLVKELFE